MSEYDAAQHEINQLYMAGKMTTEEYVTACHNLSKLRESGQSPDVPMGNGKTTRVIDPACRARGYCPTNGTCDCA